MKRHRISALALFLLAAPPLQADFVIDTTPSATGNLLPFGQTNTATYGQTFVAPAVDNSLDSFTFFFDDYMNPGPLKLAAYVAEWTGGRITGPILWAGPKMGSTNNAGAGGYEAFTVNPHITLVPGKSYVAFFSASNFFDGPGGTGGCWTHLNNPYPDGNAVYANNGDNFALLTERRWDGATQYKNFDLAARMHFTSGQTQSVWRIDGSGTWNAAESWIGPLPNNSGASAGFLGSLTAPHAPATVTLDGDKTVSRLVFDNAYGYIIAPGVGGSLILDNGGGAQVSVIQGSHTVAAPLAVADHVAIDVSSSATLSATAGITVADGNTLSKTGPGALNVAGALTLAANATLAIYGGNILTDSVQGGSLLISDSATIAILPSSSAGVSHIASLSIAGSTDAWLGALDLANNILVIHASPETRDQALADAFNQIRTARNAPSGLWSGPGITSSSATADPRHMTALGIMLNDSGSGLPIAASIHGLPLTANDIIIRYTWLGDANLDGVVNADDYFLIDSNYIPQKPGWYNGDFNYDSVINADDYFLIDSAFLGQIGPLAAARPSSPIQVPEPGAAILMTLGASAALLFARTRRR